MATSIPKNEYRPNNSQHTMNADCDTQIHEDIYAFDLTLGCRYIAFRTQNKRRNMGRSIYDIMTPSGAEELLAHMMSTPKVPMFVKTVHGTALVLSTLVPSCSTGLLIYAHIDSDILYRICRRCGIRASYSSELTVGKRCRITKYCLQNEELCLLYMSTYMRIFSDKLCDCALTGNLTQLLCMQISELSRFVGCPASIDCRGDIIAYSDFDMSMFTFLILLVLMNARMFSTDGKATIVLNMKNRIPFINFSFNIRDSELVRLPFMTALRFTAYRRNMPYDFYCDNGIFWGELSPLPKELSHFTNKSPAEISPDPELIAFFQTSMPEVNVDALLTIEEMLTLGELLAAESDTRHFWSTHGNPLIIT